jgi:Family of unknown function (DUF5808)
MKMPEPVPPEQGRFLKMPYDWREPTDERVAARMWNPDDRRLFTPKAFGWGYDLNFYWLAHPIRYITRR